MTTTTESLPNQQPTDADVMPVHGIDHLEFYVGNAAQAAYYYTRAYGFTETAYEGLETGSRDRVSHVLEQGRIRLVLTGTLTGDDEIAEHHKRHGDGVISIALSVPDAAAAYEHAVSHGARGIRTPYELTDEHGTVRLASVATYGETQHVFVERADYDGAFLPGYRGARDRRSRPRRPAGRDRPRGRQRRARPHGGVGSLLRARVRDDRADPLLRRGDLDRVLGADVEGRHRRLGQDQVPDQRAGRGQAQVADRGVPRLLRGPGVQHIAVSTTNIVQR